MGVLKVHSVILDSQRNRDAYSQLVGVVRGKHALAFAGAGVTMPLGYPDWTGLINALAAEVRLICGETLHTKGQPITVRQVLSDLKNDPPVQAQILKDNLGDNYPRLMKELFRPKDKRIQPIFDLVGLPFKHLLTSNYDVELELHHKPSDAPESLCLYHDAAKKFILELADEGCRRRVVHVHGKYDDPDQIILTDNDYGIYENSPVFKEFWGQMAVAVRLVFFGFSFADIDLLYGLRRAKKVLGCNTDRHFAIFGLPKPESETALASKLQMKYGIKPVFYLNSKNNFLGYDEFLASLKWDVIGPDTVRMVEAQATPEGPDKTKQSEIDEVAGQITEAQTQAVDEAVQRLRQITRSNVTRHHTGDLE
jgi:hypothetical protein